MLLISLYSVLDKSKISQLLHQTECFENECQAKLLIFKKTIGVCAEASKQKMKLWRWRVFFWKKKKNNHLFAVWTGELTHAVCPPATLSEYPSFRADFLLVSGLLLSSALCQVKNNVMPWRAVSLPVLYINGGFCTTQLGFFKWTIRHVLSCSHLFPDTVDPQFHILLCSNLSKSLELLLVMANYINLCSVTRVLIRICKLNLKPPRTRQIRSTNWQVWLIRWDSPWILNE